MRVLALSPGPLSQQLERLPALASLCSSVGANLQVACSPAVKAAWELLPQLEKVIPFDFEASPTLADWANLLGCVREPDFQVCLNFAEGQQVNLMLSMSHIPSRIADSGFSSTELVQLHQGWTSQRLGGYLKPLGCELDADAFRLALPSKALDKARADLPAGDGPLLVLAPRGGTGDWPAAEWSALPATISQRLDGLRCSQLAVELDLNARAAAVACADVVLSSCPITQSLAVFSGVPLVALGGNPENMPQRPELRCLGQADRLGDLKSEQILEALGF